MVSLLARRPLFSAVRPLVGMVLVLWMVVVVVGLQLQLSSQSIPRVEGAPLHPQSFGSKIANSKGCPICYHITLQILIAVQAYMDHYEKNSVLPYEVEEIMEHLCNPDDVAGVWLRRVGFTLNTSQYLTRKEPLYHVEIKMLKNYTNCFRDCLTVEGKCSFTTEYSTFDFLTKEVARMSEKNRQIVTPENEQALRDRVCSKFYPCMTRDRILISVARELNGVSSSTLLDQLKKEKISYVRDVDLYKTITRYGVFKEEGLSERLLSYRDKYVHELRSSLECENDLRPEGLERVPGFRPQDFANQTAERDDEDL